MRFIIFLIVVGVCLWLVMAFLKNRRKSDPSKSAPAGKAAETDPKAEAKAATLRRLQQVVSLCIAVKLKGEEELLAKVLGIASLLKDLLPRTNEKYPEKETTWRVNRLADGHLPKILNPYLDLDPAQRDQRRTELLALLQKMEKDLNDVAEILAQDNEMAYESKARFLETVYDKT